MKYEIYKKYVCPKLVISENESWLEVEANQENQGKGKSQKTGIKIKERNAIFREEEQKKNISC